ncbi:hypothetical protein JZ751_018489 [Albula glossodonta]|uniref:FXYD domain-containing ion transport regulator n=1 Tax=Albula glossodonta TaxID=121402 RepID=A0A8T2NZG0_9TELE|nr:hypothetical protein JZ751_018489 [Albula glossodonta]
MQNEEVKERKREIQGTGPRVTSAVVSVGVEEEVNGWGYLGQPSTSSDQLTGVSLTVPSATEESATFTEKQSTTASTGSATDVGLENDTSTTAASDTSSSSVTSTQKSSIPGGNVTTLKEDKAWDEPFKYEYDVLRHVGLGVAAVLFVTGILVLSCGKLSRMPKCRMASGKSYEVTRV